MNYRHIDTLAMEEWFTRPWLMLGTGPSLDKFDPKQWTDHNIAAIYDAFYACDTVDILFDPDKWEDYGPHYPMYNHAENIRYVGTRSINQRHIGDRTNVVMWDYDCDYDYYNARVFPDIRQYPCSNTSSFIVLWLGTMGVRQIKTYGIDGGRGVSTKVSDGYRSGTEGRTWNPDKENEGVFGHAASFGIEIVRQ